MAITYTNYTATAAQTNFAIAFPYIDATHVKALINGAATTAFTIVGSNVVLNSGASAGEIVRVYRQTPGRAADAKLMLVDFQDGSVLSEADLDKACQQLLYLAQEADETGASSLAIDWDDNYTAAGRRLKDLSASVVGDEDATTKNYVDGQALYGGAISVPQTWLKTGANFTGTTGNCTVTLSSPTPLSDNDDLYAVYYNGAGQRPVTDYTVTEAGGTYTFTLKMGSDTLASGDTVTIKNFGVSRSWIKQPLKGDTASDVALTVQRVSSGQSAKVQEWVTEDATPTVMASVDRDGNAAFKATTLTGNMALTGNLTLSGVLSAVSGDLLTVRQIVEGSGTMTVSAAWPHSTDNLDPKQTGFRIQITPKSATSKLMFFGNAVIAWELVGHYSMGVHAFFYKNSTATGTHYSGSGGEADVVPAGGAAEQVGGLCGVKSYTPGAGTPTWSRGQKRSAPIMGIIDSPGAGTPVNYDLCMDRVVGVGVTGGGGPWSTILMRADTPMFTSSQASYYDDSPYTRIWCIEIG